MQLIVLQPASWVSAAILLEIPRERKKEMGRNSLNLPASCFMRLGEQQGRIAMGISEQAGSAALHLRLAALGSFVGVLCTYGAAPVLAVGLGLIAAFVLTRM